MKWKRLVSFPNNLFSMWLHTANYTIHWVMRIEKITGNDFNFFRLEVQSRDVM